MNNTRLILSKKRQCAQKVTGDKMLAALEEKCYLNQPTKHKQSELDGYMSNCWHRH